MSEAPSAAIERMQLRQVGVEAAVRSCDDQTAPRVVEGLVGVEEADQVVGTLVRDDAPHEQDVRPVVVVRGQDTRVADHVEMRKVRHDRQHVGGREPERFELLPVELGVSERKIAPRAVRQQLASAVVALADELLVDAQKIFGRRDVVIHERHAAGKRKRRARGARSEGEMVDQQIVVADLPHHVPVINGEIFEPRVCRFDDDLGLEAGGEKGPANAQHLVADGVAVSKRRQNLVHARPAIISTPAPPAPRRRPPSRGADPAGGGRTSRAGAAAEAAPAPASGDRRLPGTFAR